MVRLKQTIWVSKCLYRRRQNPINYMDKWVTPLGVKLAREILILIELK